MLTELRYLFDSDSLYYAAMKYYYEKWKLKHVNEERFIEAIEEFTNQDMNWFFDSWLHTTNHLDYGIESFKKTKNKDGKWDIDLGIKNYGKRFMPSFMSCKGVGEAAVDEIIANRPYSDIKTMLWTDEGKWRHSKFNKKAMESLIRVRAFESTGIVGRDFESYKHMLETLVPNWSALRKSLKRNPWEGFENFKTAREDNSGLQEFTKREIILNENELFGYVSPETIITEEQIQKLADKNIPPICDWEREWLHWFVPTQVTPKRTKNGKYYQDLENILIKHY